MDCAGVAAHLVTYHFAASDLADEDRDAIDAHLLECKKCLETYLALKRAAERRPLEKPSASVRTRLREEVAEAFVPRPRGITFLVRRIPLYQGIAAAAIAAGIAFLVPSFLHGDARIRGGVAAREHGTEIDTARPRAASLTIY